LRFLQLNRQLNRRVQHNIAVLLLRFFISIIAKIATVATVDCRSPFEILDRF